MPFVCSDMVKVGVGREEVVEDGIMYALRERVIHSTIPAIEKVAE